MRRLFRAGSLALALTISAPAHATPCIWNDISQVGSTSAGYIMEIRGFFLGRTRPDPFAVQFTVLTTDTKAQVNTKILTALQAAATALGLTITAADITPAP